MGNASAKNARRLSTSTGSNSKRVHWGGPGLPAPPGKPVLIPGSSDDSQPDIVGIRWERSPSNGGSAIIGYLVEHRRMGSPHWVRSSPNLCPFPELTLSGLEPGWRYQFRVRAQNGLGLSQPSELSDPLTVTLQRSAATIPHFELELKDTTALENEQAEFVVKFSGLPVPKISWFKDGFEIFSSRRTRIITENNKSTLLIHQTALNDEGEIKCTATNRAGHISTRARLILEAAPRIRLPRQYEDGLLFEQDEAIRLKVSIAGKPVPNVTWLHDGEVIKSDDRHIIDAFDSGECSMRIPAAKRKDRGEYTVKAVNKLGEDIASFLVTVTDRPSAPGKAKIAMTLGRSVTLSWNEPEDDGGCKIGTYILEYYRIGWDVWLKAATCRQPTTTLSELIEGSEYKFRVKAENPYGVSDPSEESDVIFIPDPKRGINAPLRADKSQSQREIHRGRAERRDQSEPAKRTRSLTREEAIRDIPTNEFQTPPSRSASAHKLVLGPPPKPPRADSRVTFSDTVFLHVEKPLEDDDAPVAPTRPRTKRDKQQNSTDDEVVKEKHQVISVPERSLNIPTFTRQTTFDDSERTYSLTKEKSPSPLPTIQIHHMSGDDREKERRLLPREATEEEDEEDEEKFHGSSEIMLVLYPDEETGKKNPLIRSASEGDAEENDEDLLPPPMSLSLPELFSADHQIVEILREAVSSTELLHERAMERFYKAVAVEEAEAAKKNESGVIEKPKEGLDFISGRLRNTRLKRRLSSGSPTQAKNKWSRRRSSEGQTSPQLRGIPASLMLPVPQIIASDPNLHEDSIDEEPATTFQPTSPTPSAGLRHWDDKNMPLVPEKHAEEYELQTAEESFTHVEYRRDVKTPDREIAYDSIVADDYEESTDAETEPESDSSEDLRTLKSRILAQPIMDEEDTYHPRGRPILYVPPPDPEYRVVDTSVQARPLYTPNNNIQPKSILKKRTEEDPVPVNNFGRPIPPEKPIVERPKNTEDVKDNKEVPQEPIVTLRKKSLTDLSGTATNAPVMSELDSDNASLLNAAEVAKNRRRSNQKPVVEKKSSVEEREDLEARQAVVDHYMEIVREYSLSHAVHPITRYASNGALNNSNNSNNNTQNNKINSNKMDSGLIPSPTVQTKQIENVSMKKDEEIRGRKNNVSSRVTTPTPTPTSTPAPALTSSPVKEDTRSSRRVSRNEPSAPRSRNVSAERNPRSSSKTRTSSSTRSSSKTRAQEVTQDRVPSRSSSRTRKREKSRDREPPASRSSSRQRGEAAQSKISSRNSSRERFRTVDVSPSDSETSQRMMGRKINSHRSLERHRRNSRSYDRPDMKNNFELPANGITERLMAEAHFNVRSSMSYTIDLIILIAAAYVYLFKKEVFAIPLICLLLYRRVQEDIRGWIPKWWKAKPREQ
ncbi:titin homolog [Microplitis demolitor]|uniref:titin homolog n=1 Tax=Microplitis demolitor TaxID=69319 RepID=UPI0004CD9741|nr:titin homolog [Microplitis demolitor]